MRDVLLIWSFYLVLIIPFVYSFNELNDSDISSVLTIDDSPLL
jgi:hypothetical protein